MKLYNVLKFRIVLLHLTIFAKMVESFDNVDDVSKIVCHFNQFNALDIVPSDTTKQSIHVKISKKLMRTCNLKVKMIPKEMVHFSWDLLIKEEIT